MTAQTLTADVAIDVYFRDNSAIVAQIQAIAASANCAAWIGGYYESQGNIYLRADDLTAAERIIHQLRSIDSVEAFIFEPGKYCALYQECDCCSELFRVDPNLNELCRRCEA